MCGEARKHKFLLALVLSVGAMSAAARPGELSQDAINSATLSEWSAEDQTESPNPFLIRVQILLDRAHVSPGVIDGYQGDNLVEAIRTFEERMKLPADGEIDENFWAALSADKAPVLQAYRISKNDLAKRYVKKVPKDFAVMAKMKRVGYTGPKEMLAERFHMDQSLLEVLNPNTNFRTPGRKILVSSIGPDATEKVSRVVS